MRLILIILSPLLLLGKNLWASDVDTSFSATFGTGFSSPQQLNAYSDLYLEGSISWNTSWFVNYIALSNAMEFISNIGGFAINNTPTDYLTSFVIGHQFRFNNSMWYLPISFGISGSTGVYRGNDLGDGGYEDSPTEYYQRKVYYAPGFSLEAAPSILFLKFVIIGVEGFLNLNTHEFLEAGLGLQIGLMVR